MKGLWCKQGVILLNVFARMWTPSSTAGQMDYYLLKLPAIDEEVSEKGKCESGLFDD